MTLRTRRTWLATAFAALSLGTAALPPPPRTGPRGPSR
jgi:hypothetical protein